MQRTIPSSAWREVTECSLKGQPLDLSQAGKTGEAAYNKERNREGKSVEKECCE